MWLVLGLGLVLLTLSSRWAIAGWALLAVFVTLGQLGESLRLPAWVIGLSPYHHVPKCPAEAFAWRPVLVDDRAGRRGAGRRLVALPEPRHRLASAPCGSPSPVGSDCPVAPALRRTACGWRSRAASEVIVKRLQAPVDGDPPELSDWRSVAWWEREPQVALHGLVAATSGLRGPATLRVEDDDEGITMVQERVAEADNPGLFVARALGRFARTPPPDEPWLARGQLRERLARIERRGGWQTLARTTLADVADHLWRQRARHLAALDEAPQVLQHGDPTPANLRGRSGDDVVAIDWSSLGTGAVGHDLGLWALATREDFEPLLAAYVEGLADPGPGSRRRRRRADHGRLHVAEPAGLGAASRRRR